MSLRQAYNHYIEAHCGPKSFVPVEGEVLRVFLNVRDTPFDPCSARYCDRKLLADAFELGLLEYETSGQMRLTPEGVHWAKRIATRLEVMP